MRSTDEAAEQGRATVGGERGGKATDQGEHRAADTRPGHRAGSASRSGLLGVREAARKGKQDTVHRAAPPCDASICCGTASTP